MVKTKALTIKQEMGTRGINEDYFRSFYIKLKEMKQLPSPGDAIPWEQYKNIVDYLVYKQILDKYNKIQPENLKIFDSKLKLETIIERPEEKKNEQEEKPSGGLLPCRTQENEPHSSGGMLPCRDCDDD